MDLSKFSTADLQALKAGDLAKVSPDGLKALRTAQVAESIDNDPISRGARNFADEMPFTDQFAAGMGKAFADVGRGAAQMVGAGPSSDEVREQRKRDEPLMRTAGGVAGNVGGNVVTMAPLAVVPGANTVAAAGALGLTAAALQPTETTGERLKNMGVGFGLGAGTQFLGNMAASNLQARAQAKNAAADAAESRNAVRDRTLKAAQDEGFVVPPSAVKQSGLVRRLESVAGKAAIGQEAAVRNQAVTNKLAARELGIPENTPITEDVLNAFRDRIAAPYREVAGLAGDQRTYGGLRVGDQVISDTRQVSRNVGKDLLGELKDARFEANAQWKFYDRSADPNALKAAEAASARAAEIETTLEGIAQAAGKPELVQQLRDARTAIAKSFDIERALNDATGDVSARVLSKRPYLTGPLETAANFYKAFPNYARDGARIPTPGVSKTEALAAAALGSVGGPFAAGLPFVSGPVRSMLLSPSAQRTLATPNYSRAMTVDPEKLTAVARALALPAAATFAGAER